MNILGFEITRTKSRNLSSPGSPWPGVLWPGSPFIGIHEPFTGAWQRNVTTDPPASLLQFSAVYACVTGIASDVAKMRVKLSRESEDGVWTEIRKNSPWLPLLKRPNHFQDHIQFFEQWILSKLLHGNAYILKERDSRGIVTRLYVLHPLAVKPLVADDGSVYYQLSRDMLSQLDAETTVPAREIIHDRMCALWHPLVGVSPITACAVSATMGNRIQSDSTTFFANRSFPGGIITGPSAINDETADRIRREWQASYGGENSGKTAVLGGALKFEPMRLTADQSQLAEQLKWTVEDVARALHYPLFKLTGQTPPYAGSLQALIVGYYTDCLQRLIEGVEVCLDQGLELPDGVGTEFDTDNLMRMDTAALFESNTQGVKGGWLKPNEARNRASYEPVPGGNTPYLQHQDYSLAALAKRDAKDDPFEQAQRRDPDVTLSFSTPTPTPGPPDSPDDSAASRDIADAIRKQSAERFAKYAA